MIQFGCLFRSKAGLWQQWSTARLMVTSSGVAPVRKAPLKPYMKFVLKERPKILQNNPGLSITECAKLLGANWRQLPQDEKSKFNEEYTAEMQRFQVSLTAEEAEARRASIVEKRRAREQRRIKKATAENKKPKRPLSAYLLYVSTLPRPTDKSVQTSQDFFSDSAKKWNDMSEAQKKVFEQQHEMLKVKHEEEVYAWSVRMLQEGKVALVDKAFLAKFFKLPEKPPASSLQLFSRSHTDKSRAEILAEFAQLPQSKKKSLSAMVKDKKLAYKKAVAQWQKKMRHSGEGDIVKILTTRKTSAAKKPEKTEDSE